MGPRPARSYQVTNGIAVLPVSGTLRKQTRSLQPYSGMTGYNGVIARLQQAISDPGVDGILAGYGHAGGMVSGAFDCADIIARMRDIKPVWALANVMNCSAGQLIASSASRRLVTQTARTGSIGVMMAHSNYGAALKTNGVEVTLIYSGNHQSRRQSLTKNYQRTFALIFRRASMPLVRCLPKRLPLIPECQCRPYWTPKRPSSPVRSPWITVWRMNL